MYVTLRPRLDEFLKSLSQIYTLILFTAATEQYADEIRELIDPLECYFKLVLSRNHCLKSKKNVRDVNISL